MPFQKGHKLSKNGGRKPRAEELANVIAAVEENITTETLIKLANSKVNYHLAKMGTDFNKAERMALPIAIKAMKEQSTVTLLTPKPLDNMEDILRPEPVKPV